jgi:hypothetical protein
LAQLETPFRKNRGRRINKGLPSRNPVTRTDASSDDD